MPVVFRIYKYRECSLFRFGFPEKRNYCPLMNPYCLFNWRGQVQFPGKGKK